MIDNNMYNNYDVTLHKWINLSLIIFTTVQRGWSVRREDVQRSVVLVN